MHKGWGLYIEKLVNKNDINTKMDYLIDFLAKLQPESLFIWNFFRSNLEAEVVVGVTLPTDGARRGPGPDVFDGTTRDRTVVQQHRNRTSGLGNDAAANKSISTWLVGLVKGGISRIVTYMLNSNLK